jgi:septation ring formation regulator EzrA
LIEYSALSVYDLIIALSEVAAAIIAGVALRKNFPSQTKVRLENMETAVGDLKNRVSRNSEAYGEIKDLFQEMKTEFSAYQRAQAESFNEQIGRMTDRIDKLFEGTRDS